MRQMVACRWIASLVLAGSALALAADTPAVIDAPDKAALEAAKGQQVVVHGKVATAEWSHSGKVMNITFENAPGFGAVVFEKSRKKMDAAFNGDLAKTLTGAEVRFDGKIEPYGGYVESMKDSLQLILRNTSQITVLTPAQAPASAPAPAPAPAPATQPAAGE